MADAKAASVQALRTILLFLPTLQPREREKLAAKLANPLPPVVKPKAKPKAKRP